MPTENDDKSDERRTRSTAGGGAKVDDKSDERRTRSTAGGGAKVDDKPRDIVTEASMDSFPASDPPGWIRSAASTCDTDLPAVDVVDISDLPSDMRPSATSGPELRRLKRFVLVGGIALLAGAIGTFFFVRSRRRARA